METKDLYKHWEEVQDYFDITDESGRKLFDYIIQPYQESGRCYHTLNHVYSLLLLIDKQELVTFNRITLIITAFFHDLVYIAGSSKNETASAELMKQLFINQGITHPIIIAAAKIITDTQKHKSKDPLSQLFLDMDLSILGADEKAYETYSKQVRQEFICTPQTLYNIGRKRFIRETLERPSIFYTKYFIDNYEEQAIENLKNELNTL
ncbi:MAG: hypothetical protein MK066_00220 [Crocinitomicaceae bacterium]|nr:hypothetical protein [Crocinitomicaceae bacterium]